MKAWVGSILVLLVITLSSFQPPVSIKNIITAFKKGDAAQLSLNFNEKVEIIMPGVNDTYSAQKTRVIMQKFFAKYHITDLVVSKIGRLASGYFIIGSLQTKTATFGISIITTTVSTTEQINSIGFTKPIR